MSGDAPPVPCSGRRLPRWLIYALILGFYLSLRGYHSFDGDQAYRLPLLLHQQDARVYAGDPFVQAFEAFNPHRGSLLVLDVFTRPLGLSAGLLIVFVLTFGATCLGVDHLSRAVWPSAGSNVGLVVVGLVLAAKAGNIGTNHLFEAMVLDRLMAFALGWLALASVVSDPTRGRTRALVAVALATLVHPSVGLQLAIVLGASWTVWCLLGRWMEVGGRPAILGVVGLAIAVMPGLAVNLAPGTSLLGDMPAHDFWLLTAELQSPQHMLPHLWRMPQWLAWACYLALAALAMAGVRKHSGPVGHWSPARLRLTALLAVILLWLAAAWYAIEVRHQLRVTVFQPFRMATIARGIALVLVSGRLVALWRSGAWLSRLRAILISVAFGGDWLLVVVTLAELTVSVVEAVRCRVIASARWNAVDGAAWFGMLGLGFNFLARHDTEFGNRTLLAALGVGLIVGCLGRRRAWGGAKSASTALEGGFRDASLYRAVSNDGAGERILSPPCKGGVRGGEQGITSTLDRGGNSGVASRSRTANQALVAPGPPPLTPPLQGGERARKGLGMKTKLVQFQLLVSPGPDQVSWLDSLSQTWTPRRLRIAFVMAWVLPLASLLAAAVPLDHPASRHPLVRSLINRCRFAPIPADDVERLALWCRDHTPASARFIGPPGPKTFRLWSLRSLAFNRAASPYNAAGLADWFSRFQDHVNFHGSPEEFVRAYVADRHGFESRYQAQTDAERAALAIGQGATYVVAAGPRTGDHPSDTGPLELLHVEGRYAVYQVKLDTLVQRQR